MEVDIFPLYTVEYYSYSIIISHQENSFLFF